MNKIKIVADERNLYRAYKVSLSGRSYQKSSMQFAADPFPGLCKLRQELLSGTYRVSGYFSFMVTEPKERQILACKFRDKIVQHSLCDNILTPVLDDIYIYDNYAGRIGRGTEFARDRLKTQLLDFSKVHPDGYCYKGDIHKFYYSIDHTIAKEIMHKHYSDDIWWLIDEFIDSTEGKGIALGNQINTIISNLYLNELDQYITKTLRIKWYGRYADDFFILENDKEKLKEIVRKVEVFLNDILRLEINPKSQITPIRRGIKFIGFHFYVKDAAIESKLINSKARSHRRTFNKMCRLVEQGKISLDALETSQTSWEAHAGYANRCNFEYYRERLASLKSYKGGINGLGS